MSDFAREVLIALAKQQDFIGWYGLEKKLSEIAIDKREYLPAVLKWLEHEGLVEKNENQRYRLTREGRLVVQTYSQQLE